MAKSIICESESYHPAQGRLYYWGFTVTATILVILFSETIGSFGSGFVIWVILMALSLLLIQPIQRKILRRGVVEINDKYIRISEYKDYEDVLVSDVIIQWQDIREYYWGVTGSGTRLKLYLKNGTKADYCFMEGKTHEQAMSQKSIFSVFFYFLTEHNRKQNNATIFYRPGFLVTTAGAVLLYLLSGLIVFGLVAPMAAGRVVGTWRGVILFVPIIRAFNRRSAEQKFAASICSLQPLSWDVLSPAQDTQSVGR